VKRLKAVPMLDYGEFPRVDLHTGRTPWVVYADYCLGTRPLCQDVMHDSWQNSGLERENLGT
jgi:hypothetical protein